MLITELIKKSDKSHLRETTETLASIGTSLTTIQQWTGAITVEETSIVIVKARLKISNSSYITNEIMWCRERLMVGGYMVGGETRRVYNETGSNIKDNHTFLVLPAGTYDITLEAVASDADYFDAGYVHLYIGSVKLSDSWLNETFQCSGTVAAGSRNTIASVSYSGQALRDTCLGKAPSKSKIFIVTGVPSPAGIWYGDGASSNWFGWRVLIDGSQIGRNERPTPTSNTFNYGIFYKEIDPTVDHTLDIQLSNGTGSSKSATIDVGMFMCPWIVINADFTKLLDLDIPSQTTMYAAIESFWEPETAKDLIIYSPSLMQGNVSVYSASQASSSDPLEANYTPEWYMLELSLHVKNKWNVISRLAADVRS